MWPHARIPMYTCDAEMLEGVFRDLDDFPVSENEGLRTGTAFGDHGYGADEAELFVDARA